MSVVDELIFSNIPAVSCPVLPEPADLITCNELFKTMLASPDIIAFIFVNCSDI